MRPTLAAFHLAKHYATVILIFCSSRLILLPKKRVGWRPIQPHFVKPKITIFEKYATVSKTNDLAGFTPS